MDALHLPVWLVLPSARQSCMQGCNWVCGKLLPPSHGFVRLQAKAILAKATAKAEGLQAMLNMAEPELVRFYLALDKNLFTDMAGEHWACLCSDRPCTKGPARLSDRRTSP